MSALPPGPRAPAVVQILRWLRRPIEMLEDFLPDRFLDAKPGPYEFFPFGGGTRHCLGAAFATYEMKIVLAEILVRTELRAAPGYQARIVRRGITFAPSAGMPLIVERRAA